MGKKERKGGRRLALSVLVWAASVFALLLLAAVLANKLGCRQKDLALLADIAVLLAGAAAALFLCSGQEHGRLRCGMLFGLGAAAFLILCGFLALGDSVTWSGAAKVCASSLAGASVGAFFSGGVKRSASGRRTRSFRFGG
ncbi:MAG: hypothetical protein K6G17_03510 [Oscillospiraceae bacterium]|nr:hypothetical protein [Oscillospiraceae bacterium]